MSARAVAAVLSLLPSLAAQVIRDSFDHPDGPAVPGWTQQRSTWEVIAGRVRPTSNDEWAYLTLDGYRPRNCTIDAKLYFVRFGAQFAGLTSRHPGGDGDVNLLMTKIQNNGGGNDFDRMFSYERGQPLGSFFQDMPSPTTSAICRMITVDGEMWLECDADMDGIFELSLPRRPLVSVVHAGFVGVSAFRTRFGASEIDDFELHDAVLAPRPGSVPRLGMVYQLDLDTPSPGVPWLGMLSLGNAGIAIGPRPRYVPVSLDDLLVVSLSVGIGGITDGRGKAVMSLPIPNDQRLAGVGFYAAAVTIDAALPFGVGHIANEQHFRVQR